MCKYEVSIEDKIDFINKNVGECVAVSDDCLSIECANGMLVDIGNFTCRTMPITRKNELNDNKKLRSQSGNDLSIEYRSYMLETLATRESNSKLRYFCEGAIKQIDTEHEQLCEKLKDADISASHTILNDIFKLRGQKRQFDIMLSGCQHFSTTEAIM